MNTPVLGASEKQLRTALHLTTSCNREKRAHEREEDEAAWGPTEGGGQEYDDDDEDDDKPGAKQKGKGAGNKAAGKTAQQHGGGAPGAKDQQKGHHGGRGEKGEVDLTARLRPIEYAHLADIPVQPPLAPQQQQQQSEGGMTRMAVCDPAEVGDVEERLVPLGMPKRPRWQGVVSTAEQLHALEERSFAEWQQVL